MQRRLLAQYWRQTVSRRLIALVKEGDLEHVSSEEAERDGVGRYSGIGAIHNLLLLLL